MKLTQETPEASLDVSGNDEFIVVTKEKGDLLPLLDYSKEPQGARYPCKVFSSVENARRFCAQEGHENIQINQIF